MFNFNRKIHALNLVAVCSIFVLSGCDTYRKIYVSETSHLGGVGGWMADSVLYARTKEAYLWRSIAAVAIISEAGSSSTGTDDDARDIVIAAERIKRRFEEIYPLLTRYENKYSCYSIAAPCDGKYYYVDFERRLPGFEDAVYKYFVSNLPQIHVKEITAQLASQDYLGAAFKLADVLGDTAKSAHYAAAAYRSVREAFGQIVQRSIGNEGSRDQLITVDDAVLFSQKFQENGTVLVNGERIPLKFLPEDFEYLFYVIRDSCKKVSRRSSDSNDAVCDGIKPPRII